MNITDCRSRRTSTPVRLILCALTNLIVLGGLHAQEDGVYESAPGNGPAVRLKILSGNILPLTNSNDLFNVDICFEPDGRPSGTVYYVVLDGRKKKRSSNGMNGENPTFSLDNLTHSEATSASALFGLPVQLRKHPGHRIDATFTTDKPEYAPGDPITVTVTIRNLGDEPIYFTKLNVGPKDDSFSFAPVSIPFGNAEVTKTYIGGGVSIVETLPAHGAISIAAKLDEWHETKIPGSYYFLGSYILEMFKDRNRPSFSPIWVDYATRLFHFDVKKPR
jgi:hypothetical protein